MLHRQHHDTSALRKRHSHSHNVCFHLLKHGLPKPRKHVNIKYANCLKALENDGELASVVKAVRAAIGTGEVTESAEDKPEDTEV